MGTNYYLHSNVCSHCGVGDAPLHIGKQSAGWAFSWHGDKGQGLESVQDWREHLEYEVEGGGEIRDEDYELLSIEEFFRRVRTKGLRHAAIALRREPGVVLTAAEERYVREHPGDPLVFSPGDGPENWLDATGASFTAGEFS